MRRAFSFLLLGGLLLLALAPWAPVQSAPDEAATKKKMQGWAHDLGVKCSYCHVGQGRQYDFKASTPHKEIAHYCEENFVGKLGVLAERGRAATCADCHQGRTQFLPRPAG